MSKHIPVVSKGSMSSQERAIRSRLAQLVSGKGLIRGTLTTRERVCGKQSCKCTREEKHVGLYLVVSREGKVRQLFIPQAYEQKVRQWIEEYRRAEELLDTIADLYWAKCPEA
jgi:hypothetical protein